jgi:tetratricopeptide (TPR) repeat protein
MCTRILFTALLISLLATLVAITIGNPKSVSAGEPSWVEIRSPNFSVVTDAGEKRGREVAMRFEQMRAVFGALMTKAKVNLPVPLQIVAFRGTKEMRQVAPLWNGKPTQVAGLFQGGEDRCFIMLDMSVPDPYPVVFHEYAHQLMNGNMHGEMDPWFEEGFAEYFASIEVDNKQARVGKVPADEYLVLQHFGMIKIADLFKVVQNSSTYNESGDHRNSFYAESGMLVHYIYDNQLLPKVAAYFNLKEYQHVPVEGAIQQAFGMTAAEFDKALRNYVSAARYRYYPIPTPPNISTDKYTVTSLKATDAAAVVADIHLHSRDYREQALNEFQDILKSDPNNSAACRGLGYGYLEKQDFTLAAEYFKRASQTDSKDPRVHYYNALLMARESGFNGGGDLSDMTRELEASLTLDPSFADSYALLAFAQSTSGDSGKALATMQKALEISPRNESYLYNLANIYLANRQPDQAVAILSSLQVSDNPALAAQVSMLLTQARKFREAMQQHPQGIEQGALPPRREESDAKSDPLRESPPSSTSSRTVGKWGAPKFVHGIINGVDCSSALAAVLALQMGTKTVKLTVNDRDHVILIGADQFSCAWNKRKVAVNYRENDAGDTSVMSIELQ